MLENLIDRPVAVTMLLLSVCVLGIISALKLPMALIPDVDVPYITVQLDDPRLSARELDERVVRPLRAQLVQMDGIAGIHCTARDGSANLRLSFHHGDRIDYRFIEVNEKIDRAMSSLQDIGRPKVIKASASDLPAYYINLTGREKEIDFLSLSRFAQDVIVKRLEQLDEVAMADISGLERPEIRVIPDLSRLRQSGLTLDDLERLVAGADIRLGSLTIADGQYRYNVRFNDHIRDKDDIAELWLNYEGHLLQLKDIAQVIEEPAPRSGLVLSDGKPAVSLAVVARSDARLSDLHRSVGNLLDTFSREYPQLVFTLTRDQTRLLNDSIRNLIQNILLAILLACLVIFVFLRDGRTSLLVAITIPSTLIISMLFFRLLGMSLNIVSLSGLLLGVGMMTDNSLVLVDNVTGRWQRGDQLRRSVLEGTREVLGPMFSSILTTCAVFVPLVSVRGMAGALFKDQALSVSIVLFTSYLVTILVIPVYYWTWYRRKRYASPPHHGKDLSVALERWDHQWTSWMMDHRFIAWILLAVSVLGCAMCFLLMPKKLLPELTRTETLMHVDWGSNLSPEENIRRCRSLSEIAQADQTTVMAGVQQFLLDHDALLGPGEAQLYFQFQDADSLSLAESSLSSEMAFSWPGVPYSFEPAGNVFDLVFGRRDSPLVARLRPISQPTVTVPELRSCLDALREALPKVEITSVPVQEQVLFVADPQKMAVYDVGYDTVMESLRRALDGDHLMNIVQGDQSVPVVMGVNRTGLSELLERTTVHALGTEISLSALLRQDVTEDLKVISSGPEGEFYPVPFEISATQVPTVMRAVRDVVNQDGRFDVSFSGSWFETHKMIRDLLMTLLIAVVLLYLILAAQFESLSQPLLILSEILIDIFFALAALWILGESINLMSLIGLVVITGIVVNDSILKVDTINRLRRSGMRLEEAILAAGARRVKAILMTSLTTILAVVPFLVKGNMGADLQYSMTIVIIAGMLVGTLVSLFVVPALYYSLFERDE